MEIFRAFHAHWAAAVFFTLLIVTVVILDTIKSRRLRKQAAAATAGALENMRKSNDARVAQLSQNQAQYYELVEQSNAITVFIRDAYSHEAKLGYHTGRSLSEIVIGYLTRERQLNNSAQLAASAQAFK